MMKKGCKLIILVSGLWLLTGCQSTQKEKTYDRQAVEKTITQFLQTYAFREDFEKFLSFYADNAVIEDVIRGERISGSDAIKTHLNWQDPEFSLGRSATHLVREQVIIDKNKVTIRGYFMPFIYQGVKLGPWRFTTHLELNEDLKIIKQTDWVNYTPKVIFNNSPNSNSDIKIPQYYFNSELSD